MACRHYRPASRTSVGISAYAFRRHYSEFERAASVPRPQTDGRRRSQPRQAPRVGRCSRAGAPGIARQALRDLGARARRCRVAGRPGADLSEKSPTHGTCHHAPRSAVLGEQQDVAAAAGATIHGSPWSRPAQADVGRRRPARPGSRRAGGRRRARRKHAHRSAGARVLRQSGGSWRMKRRLVAPRRSARGCCGATCRR